ncbi:unnamed protein product [Arabidopsis lyrata]|uniref:RNase H type-1 domain-containing protein n=1 Tax=Arabidopsis lyrata subsp. lyrata TaxID=81972 RepID=D7MDT3_ARALL|nr:hypothetical protein ARALYDRAFT_913766 [Arabidopsis lyrata subsp. lyrata]CAH8275139.1 unnamed protein product [Arabidopsis lyrata]
MTPFPLSFSSHSRPFPKLSVSFLDLRPPTAPPTERPSPSTPPEPPDLRFRVLYGVSYAQPPLAAVSSLFIAPIPSPSLDLSSLCVSPVAAFFALLQAAIKVSASDCLGGDLQSFTALCSGVQTPSIVPTAILPSVPPGSLVVVIRFLAFAVNSWDWFGLVQPCVSLCDRYVAFPCAPTAVGISWVGFVMNCVCTWIQTGSLPNGQPRPSWALLSIYMTSEGLVFVTLCYGLHRPSNSLLLVPNYLSMRIYQFQVPHYEDVFKYDQNLVRMVVRSPKGWHFVRQPLEIIISGFGFDLKSAGSRESVGVLSVVDGLCARLGFTEENICVIKSQLIQPPPQKMEVFLSFSEAAWFQSKIFCGLGWCFKDPLNGKIHHGSFSRPFVLSVLVAEALALKAAFMAALALGVSRLACISDCRELVLLSNTGGHANELDGILADFDLFRSMFLSTFVHFVPRSENYGTEALANASLLSCIFSSIGGV